MFNLLKKEQIFKKDAKCLDGNFAGSDSKQIFNLKTKEMYELDSSVICIQEVKDELFYGLADGTLGFMKVNDVMKANKNENKNNKYKNDMEKELSNKLKPYTEKADKLLNDISENNFLENGLYNEKSIGNISADNIKLLDKSLTNKQIFETFKLHDNRICKIMILGNKIITSSWDQNLKILIRTEEATSCVFNKKFYKIETIKHPATAWCFDSISENTIVTGCADNKIRIFYKLELIKVMDFHNSPVRGLLFIENSIFSVDNYGVVMKFTKDGRLLKIRVLDELCFKMTAFKNYILISGEKWICFYFRL